MGKILAALLLLVGGSITLYILYKVMYAIIEPAVTRKLEEKMARDKMSSVKNNLTVHQHVEALEAEQLGDKHKT